MMQLIPGQHIHFVGIGGSGMSAIARVLLEQGYHISGSDLNANELIDALRRDGAEIHIGHDPAHVTDAEMVVMSSAAQENIEVLSATAQGIPVYRRVDMVGEMMRGYVGIAIAGTHGKTTTTAMTTHILMHAGLQPTYIVGGVMLNTGTNAGLGDGNVFVIEADEYDNMFHGLRPQVQVLTSIEYDHPDFFKTPGQMMASFLHFVGLLPRDGLLIACADDAATEIFARNREIVGLPVLTYGIENRMANWRAANIRYDTEKTLFDVTYKGHFQGTVALNVPGEHNVLNALAALIVASSQQVKFADAAAALATFKGTGRRFEVRADVNDIAVIDDYAHHPTAIKRTIHAAKRRYPDREIWAVWQPHTYSRTRRLQEEFMLAFDEADHVVITEIFAAREHPHTDYSAAQIVEDMPHPHAQFAPLLADAVEVLREQVTSPAVILIMSAGNAQRIGIDYLAGSQAKGTA